MSLIFNSDAYFCEGNVTKKWQFEMELGIILLKEDKISLVKQSNISLTEIGTSIDNYQERFKIPFKHIRKVYTLMKGKIIIIKIETRDDFNFSIILTNQKKYGKNRSIELIDLINASILNFVNSNDILICQYCNNKLKPNSTFCQNCGEKIKSNVIL
ncbi:MAG: zinc ribbon domain-containing protein [Candidatus Lokiarchaeota archaeon]|nr:zinc ribbon domain-containing protein [Candidatus Lokiarchaeota archaeon]